MSARFRPLSTRVLCTLKLHALNPADTSWLPFNYYVGEQWRMHCLNRALQAHSHPYSKVVLQQAQASTAPPGTGQTYVHTQLLTQNGQYYTTRTFWGGKVPTYTTQSLAICSPLLHYVQHTTCACNSECPNTQHTPHTVVHVIIVPHIISTEC